MRFAVFSAVGLMVVKEQEAKRGIDRRKRFPLRRITITSSASIGHPHPTNDSDASRMDGDIVQVIQWLGSTPVPFNSTSMRDPTTRSTCLSS